MAHDVFVSYSHEDHTVANAVVATLESHGIRCWIAPRDIPPGEDWAEAILDAIKEAQAVVLIFSSHSNESEQIKREVERTVHQGIAVIPFRIEDVLPSKTLEYFISTQHWLDALTPPLEDHLAHLADTLTVLLAKKVGKAKPPKVAGDEPAPAEVERRPEVKPPPKESQAVTVSGPPGKLPLIWIASLVGVLVVLVVAVGIWWRSSHLVVTTTGAPAPAPPTAALPAPPAPMVTQQPAPPPTTRGPTVSVQGGKLVIAPPPNRWRVVLNQDQILPNDMDISVSLTFQKVEDSTKGSGLVFWAKDYSDYYALVLTPNGRMSVQHFTSNRWLVPVPWRDLDNAKKGETAENILKVVTKGNEAIAYVNHKEIISFTGDPPQGGCLVGFKGSSGPQGVSVAAFADLKVIGPSQVLGFKPDPKQADIIRLFKIKASADLPPKN